MNPWDSVTVKMWELEFLRENLRKIELQFDEAKGGAHTTLCVAMGRASGKASALAEMLERMIDEAQGVYAVFAPTEPRGLLEPERFGEPLEWPKRLTLEQAREESGKAEQGPAPKLTLAQARQAGGYDPDDNSWSGTPARFTK